MSFRLPIFGKNKKSSNQSIDVPKHKSIKSKSAPYEINGTLIYDRYTLVNNPTIPIDKMIVELIEHSVFQENFQYAFINTPLDFKTIGENSLIDKRLCLLVGKMMVHGDESFIWVYRSFEGKWFVCSTNVHKPNTITHVSRLINAESVKNQHYPKTINLTGIIINKLASAYKQILDTIDNPSS